MANRYFRSSQLYNFNENPVFLEGRFTVGSSGAVSAIKGSGISTVTRLTTGIYKFVFEDAYYRFLKAHVQFIGGVTGSAVAGGSFVTGTLYQIVTLGTTTTAQFRTAGLSTLYTAAAVGQCFVAVGAGAGTGTVKAVGSSAVFRVELGDQNIDSALAQKLGIIAQCYNASDAIIDPNSGSTCVFSFMLRNSSVKGKGE